jgi:Ca-activated chloride channel family protein
VSFEEPTFLLSLLVIPVVLATYVATQGRRRRVAQRFANAALFPNLVDRSPGWRRHAPLAVLLAALTALLVGLARPHANLSVPQEEATVVLALDTSRSMAAKDIEPSRLAVVKKTALDFLQQVPEKFRVAVVAFASDAEVVAPPTQDRTFPSQAIAQLKTGEGTALGDAIARSIVAARSVVGRSAGSGGSQGDAKVPPTSILVLSDGAAEGGRVSPAEAIRMARALQIPVHTVAFGTDDGIVEVPRVGGFVERIRVPPSPDTLRRIATQTGGTFFQAASQQQLEAVYGELKSRLGSQTKPREVTAAFAAGGILLMLVGGGLSAFWFRRLP